MQTIGHQQDGDTLKRLEQQINQLSGQLLQRGRASPFPAGLEADYCAARNQRFLEIDLRIIVGGLLFYLLFGWSDVVLGGANGSFILLCRLALTLVLFALLLWIPRSLYHAHMLSIAAAGVAAAGLSVVVFIVLIPDEMRFAYHLGMVPIQVFAMVTLRLSVRAMVSVSVVLYLAYGLMLLLTPQYTGLEQLDHIISVFLPLFLAFWLVLILMGVYLAFAVETAARNDYLQNRLLTLEADRLQILSRQLALLSTTDALTGIANRRYFEQQFEREWKRAARQQQPLALIMVDVDHFKEYNDYYGHQQGDHCLQQLSQAMAAQCQRSGDVCARYGGEEFVVLLPDTQAAEAAMIAENIRCAVEELGIEHCRSDQRLCTVSAGVASIVPGEYDRSDELLRRADRGLYEAKDKGRNFVAIL